MARTLGAINKPKYIVVKLSEINRVFKPEAEIKIASEYGIIFNGFEEIKTSGELEAKPETKVKTEVNVIDFNK